MKRLRGNLYLADLNPRYGTEPGKLRPVLILQNDIINESHPSTLICPLTSKTRPEVKLLRVHLKKGEGSVECDSDIMLDQIRSIDNRRLKRHLGKLSKERLSESLEKIYGRLILARNPIQILQCYLGVLCEGLKDSLPGQKLGPLFEDFAPILVNLEKISGVDILEFLMEQHSLRQVDLVDELGSQSIVSEILSHKRKLNSQQIYTLSKRFGISPSAFYP